MIKCLGYNNENIPFVRVTFCNKPKVSFWKNLKHKESGICDLLTCYFIFGTDRKDMETKSDNQFKKIVSEWKPVSLIQRIASGIARYQVEKGYGKWWAYYFL